VPTVRTLEASSRSVDFVALGHPGSEHYAGLETFANPGVSQVEMTSDELAAVCPVTGQPDLYVATIEYRPVGFVNSIPLQIHGIEPARQSL